MANLYLALEPSSRIPPHLLITLHGLTHRIGTIPVLLSLVSRGRIVNTRSFNYFIKGQGSFQRFSPMSAISLMLVGFYLAYRNS